MWSLHRWLYSVSGSGNDLVQSCQRHLWSAMAAAAAAGETGGAATAAGASCGLAERLVGSGVADIGYKVFSSILRGTSKRDDESGEKGLAIFSVVFKRSKSLGKFAGWMGRGKENVLAVISSVILV